MRGLSGWTSGCGSICTPTRRAPSSWPRSRASCTAPTTRARCWCGRCSRPEPKERARALAVVYLLVSAPAWQAMREQSGLDGVEAGKAAAWALRVLTDELRRNPASLKEVDE